MPKDDKRPPAFMLYVNDFCSDGIVEAMTTEEVGAYFLLLCKAWLEDPAGSVPDDDRVLARWARLTPQRWAKCKPGVMAAFKQHADSRWHQGRMKKEYAKWLMHEKDKSKRGKHAANARWGDADALQTHGSGNGSAYAERMPNDAISISSSISPSLSNSSDDDDDGAKDSLFSERARACARRIAKVVQPVKPRDVELIAKVAKLWDAGVISDDDLNQVLESYAVAEHPIRNKPAWFQECMTNRVSGWGGNFPQLLVTTNVPKFCTTEASA